MKPVNEISRRNLLKTAAAAVGVVGATASKSPAQVPAAAKAGSRGKPRALVLMGDRYHNQNDIRTALNRVFQELGLSVDYTTNYYDLSAALLKPYQLFVCFRDNMIWPGGYEPTTPVGGRPTAGLENPGEFPEERAEFWITEEQGKAVQDFVAAGNGFYSMHNNGFVSRSSKNYRKVQGGVGLGHPALRPFKVKVVNKDHPITQGVQDFMVTDEQHYQIYDKDPKNILLQSENLDGLTFKSNFRDPSDLSAGAPRDLGSISISGWAHEFGKGRVAFTAIGHTTDAMWQPEHLKIQKNSVRWLLKIS